MRKILALALALIMALSLCATVWAEDDYYAPSNIDMGKSGAGSEINTTFTFDKLFDGKYYGGMGDTWHSETGLTNDPDGRTLTVMFKSELEVAGLRVYPRTLNGSATPTEMKVIGIYASGEKEIATATFNFELLKVADVNTEENIARKPSAYLFDSGVNKKLLGLKLVVTKTAGAGTGHVNFTELQILMPGAKADAVPAEKPATTTPATTPAPTPSAPVTGTVNSGTGNEEVYKATEILDMGKSGAGSEINTTFVFDKLFDGVCYGGMGETWHSMTGIANDEAARTLTFMFKGEIGVDGFRIYPRTLGGAANPTEIRVIGVYKDGEKEIAYTNLNYETIKVADPNTEEDVARKPVSFLFDSSVNKKMLGMKFILEKNINKGSGHFNFTELEFLKATEKAEPEKYTLVIGSKEITSLKGNKTLDVAPYIDNGSTLIPLRGLVEEMGAEIGWDGATQTITITKGVTIITLQIGSKAVKVSGKTQQLPVAPVITESRTFIPVRFVSEVLGYEVGWDGATQTVTITK